MTNRSLVRYECICLLSILQVFGFSANLIGQNVIVEQDFDTASTWDFSSDIAMFDNGWGRDGFFGIINIASAAPLDNKHFSVYILGENDLDDEGDNGTSGFAHITFSETDISSYNKAGETVLIMFDYDIKGYNAYGDDIYYQTFYDGVGQGKVYLLDGGVDAESDQGKVQISIPEPVNSVSLVLSLRNNGVTGYSGFDNFKIITAPIKPEPDRHVLSLDVYAEGFSKIKLTWVDAVGEIEPDGYIVIAKREDAEFDYPIDGTDSFEEPEWNGNQVEVKLDKAKQEYTFTGLNQGTPYEFSIVPFTNSGSNIDYKTGGIIPVAGATTLSAPPVIINEFLADPDTEAGDANNDGVVSSFEDEFVEIVNIGPEDLDISGWIIADQTSNRHIFMHPTILKPDQAAVVFGGGYPMGDFGGAYIATASGGHLGLNNSSDEIIIKTGEGTISISYGAEAGSNQSLTRNPDATVDAPFVKHTSIEGIATSFSPGTISDGSCFGTAYAILYGEEGWRMMGSPVNGVTYSELLSTFWTQGISRGAKSPKGAANVLGYSDSGFAAFDDLLGYPSAGEGFIMYVYGDDNHDGYDDYFPKLFYTNAEENIGPVAPPIYSNSGHNAWTLLANPYASPINFDLLTKRNVSSSVYVYDHFSASYKVWNGITGSLANGDIVPFQGFWVQQTGSNPAVVMEESDKVDATLNRFYKKDRTPVIELIVQHRELLDHAYLSFSQTGEPGIDVADAYKLSPLDNKPHISLSTTADSTQLSINNLPANPGKIIEIPIVAHINQTEESGGREDHNSGNHEILLTWHQIESIPADWDISIRDRENGKEINLRSSEQYVYHQPTRMAKVAKKIEPGYYPELLTSDSAKSRLSLVITPRTTAIEVKDLPGQIELHQNYPNPFNPVTNIGFSLQEDTEIELVVYNITGQKVALLADGYFAAGEHNISWNAEHLNSGSYFCELKTANKRLISKMTFLK